MSGAAADFVASQSAAAGNEMKNGAAAENGAEAQLAQEETAAMSGVADETSLVIGEIQKVEDAVRSTLSAEADRYQAMSKAAKNV